MGGLDQPIHVHGMDHDKALLGVIVVKVAWTSNLYTFIVWMTRPISPCPNENLAGALRSQVES